MSKHKVALVMQEFLYEDGTFVYSGGDRYTRDLAHLVKDLGMEPTIFQKGKEFFDKSFEGVRVVGLPSKTPADLNMDVAQNTQEYKATVYFNVLLGYPRVHRRSVSISHGIWFDHVKMPPASDDKWDKFRTHLQSCISAVDHVVSVDTNTINFFGGLFAGRYAEKFIHIPNAVDTKMYKPLPKVKKDTVRVLYPRRWEILRGSTEMMRLSEELAPQHPKAEFHFCGRAHSPGEEAAVDEWAKKNPQFSWYWKPFDEMPAVYQGADIGVIPTIGCEGISYSLLECLASGVPVVTTYVGGLSEAVIDGFNGIKVAPRYEEIRNAVDYLIRNPAERDRMGRNARAVGERFGIEKWKSKWGDVLHDLVR